MKTKSNWIITPNKVLSTAELAQVTENCQAKAYGKRASLNAMLNLAILRLGSMVGMRASEQINITLDDVALVPTKNKSHVKISGDYAKGGKSRIAMIWSENTVRDLEHFKNLRISQGASGSDPFLCSMANGSFGKPLTRQAIRLKTKTCCKVLGPERVKSITAHTMRHCFISHAIKSGINICAIRDAAGHSSLSVTQHYAHVLLDENFDWSMD